MKKTITSARPGLVGKVFFGTLLACVSGVASAAVYNWDGGNGNWNTSTANWGGSTWPASGTDNDAVFGNSAGTVTLSVSGIAANDLTFNTSGYTIAGSPLTLNGTTPTVDVTTGSATISANLIGSTLAKAGSGTLNVSGTSHLTSSIAVSAGTFRVTAGTTRSPSISGAGTLRLEGGTLRADAINGPTLSWGAGTLAHSTTNGVGADTTEYSSSSSPVFFGAASVKSGTELNITGDVATASNSVLDLGTAHTTAGAFRFNRLLVSGNMDMTNGGILRLSFDPYFLRAQHFDPSEIDYGTIPLVTFGSRTGFTEFSSYQFTFTNIAGNPFSFQGVNNSLAAADLPVDTFSLQYTSNAILLHYKVSPTIPEPASASLIFLAVAGARVASRFRRRLHRKEVDADRFDQDREESSESPWFDPSAKL